MTSIVDSRAHFDKRCAEFGLSVRSIHQLRHHGYDTLGKLAFGAGQPGTTLVDADFNSFPQNVLSHVMVLAQLRESVSNHDAGTTRFLPAVERQAKMSDLRARILGVIIQHQLEPYHALLDLVSQQWVSQQLEYIPPEKCS